MEYENLKLKDVILLEDKKRKPLSAMERNKRKGIYPYYGAQEIIDSIDDYIFDGKYILLAEDGENLKSRKKDLVKIVEGKFWLNNHAHIFKTKENVDLEYLYYYLLRMDLSEYITGSTQPKLNQDNMNKIQIKLPKLEIQKKISKILSDIDKKIDLNNEINNNLYELSINYLHEKSESNEVSVSKFAKIQGGYAFKSKDLIDTYTKNRIIKIKNLRSEINADVINSQFVEDEVVKKLDNKFKLRKGDVAIAMTGAELGKTGFIYGNDNYYLNQRVGVVRGNNIASELYLNVLFLSEEFQTLLNSKGYGSAQPNVSTSDIENILINDMPENNLNEFYEKIKPIYEKIISNSEEILILENLRDTLLPKLMNGEIDLDSIEI